jgi:hypothetical protein
MCLVPARQRRSKRNDHFPDRVLTDSTTTKDDRGLFGLEKEHLSSVVLIPGLKVDVDGTKAGRAENRQVEVKVLVNKGIAGS